MSKDEPLSGKKSPNRPGVDADAIRELSQLLNETGLTEIEIEHNGARIRVSRAAVNAVIGGAASLSAPPAPDPHPPQQPRLDHPPAPYPHPWSAPFICRLSQANRLLSVSAAQ